MESRNKRRRIWKEASSNNLLHLVGGYLPEVAVSIWSTACPFISRVVLRNLNSNKLSKDPKNEESYHPHLPSSNLYIVAHLSSWMEESQEPWLLRKQWTNTTMQLSNNGIKKCSYHAKIVEGPSSLKNWAHTINYALLPIRLSLYLELRLERPHQLWVEIIIDGSLSCSWLKTGRQKELLQ